MSRHRDFRKLNINDELDDDALSDGGEEPMTEEQENELYDALESVRAIIGNAQASGISDSELRDCLWQEYNDVNRTVEWALAEQGRKRVALERKDSALEYFRSRNLDTSDDQSRVPKIILAQQQAFEQDEAHDTYAPQDHTDLPLEHPDSTYFGPYRPELSTITERSEITTESSHRALQLLERQQGGDSSRTTSYGEILPIREREKVQKAVAQRSTPNVSGSSSATPSGATTPKKTNINVNSNTSIKFSTPSTSAKGRKVDQEQLDISALGLGTPTKTNEAEEPAVPEEVPKVGLAKEKLLEEARRAIDGGLEGKKAVSIVVIGHVDAGKSTLMGRLLYELGRVDEKTKRANERGSSKVGKSSFSWAWGLDGTTEERERGITMDIAQQYFTTPHRQITVLDAPGHKDFVPNMISGASQADCAVLVVDAGIGQFEAGFERGGQTREHVILVRSLGVSQVIVAVNKLDQVDWSRARFEEIESSLRSFLSQSGFSGSKMTFVPVGATLGVNLVDRKGEESKELNEWFSGPTLVDYLDKLEPPLRDYTNFFRLPISNIFKMQSMSSVYVAGRVASGIVQVGEKLRAMPGDDSIIGIVKSIEVEDVSVKWAMAGSNVAIALANIDPVNLNIGSVLCFPGEAISLATVFTARVIVFDIAVPITTGASVELFNQSRDVPATTSKLLSLMDRSTGKVSRKNPRVLVKGASAEVEITLRGADNNVPPKGIPLEQFAANKDMGRILLRRNGETIAAGIVLEILG